MEKVNRMPWNFARINLSLITSVVSHVIHSSFSYRSPSSRPPEAGPCGTKRDEMGTVKDE